MFAIVKSWLERRTALKDLRAVVGQDNHGYERYFSEQIAAVKDALAAGANSRAQAIWREMRTRFPDLCMTSEAALNVVLDLGHYDEAEALIQEARRLYPKNGAIYAAILARVPFCRGDINEALSRCESLRKSFPRSAEGYTIAAECLIKRGQEDDAEAMLGRGVHANPNDAEIATRHAQCAARREDWPEALRRNKILAERFELTGGILGAAQALRQMGRIEEAKNMLTEAAERLRTDPWPYAELASLASSQNEFQEAARIWASILRRFSFFDLAYLAGAEAMRKAGQPDEADNILRIAVLRSPGDQSVHIEYARGATLREDWPSAAERWAAVREKFPDCAEAGTREAEARSHIVT